MHTRSFICLLFFLCNPFGTSSSPLLRLFISCIFPYCAPPAATHTPFSSVLLPYSLRPWGSCGQWVRRLTCVTSWPCSRNAVTRRTRRGRRRNQRQRQVKLTPTHTHSHKTTSTNPVLLSQTQSPFFSSPHIIPRILLMLSPSCCFSLTNERLQKQTAATELNFSRKDVIIQRWYSGVFSAACYAAAAVACEPLIKDHVRASASSLPTGAAVTASRYCMLQL